MNDSQKGGINFMIEEHLLHYLLIHDENYLTMLYCNYKIYIFLIIITKKRQQPHKTKHLEK